MQKTIIGIELDFKDRDSVIYSIPDPIPTFETGGMPVYVSKDGSTVVVELDSTFTYPCDFVEYAIRGGRIFSVPWTRGLRRINPEKTKLIITHPKAIVDNFDKLYASINPLDIVRIEDRCMAFHGGHVVMPHRVYDERRCPSIWWLMARPTYYTIECPDGYTYTSTMAIGPKECVTRPMRRFSMFGVTVSYEVGYKTSMDIQRLQYRSGMVMQAKIKHLVAYDHTSYEELKKEVSPFPVVLRVDGGRIA